MSIMPRVNRRSKCGPGDVEEMRWIEVPVEPRLIRLYNILPRSLKHNIRPIRLILGHETIQGCLDQGVKNFQPCSVERSVDACIT